jgi:hypothetical protein
MIELKVLVIYCLYFFLHSFEPKLFVSAVKNSLKLIAIVN